MIVPIYEEMGHGETHSMTNICTNIAYFPKHGLIIWTFSVFIQLLDIAVDIQSPLAQLHAMLRPGSRH